MAYLSNQTRYVYYIVITVFFLCCGSSLQAQAGKKSELKVSLSGRQLKLQEVFKAITSQTSLRFVYNSGQLNDQEKVTVSFRETPLDEALQQLLQNKGLSWTYVDNAIVLRPETKKNPPPGFSTGNRQDTAGKVFTGKVADKNGGPVAGATIVIKGSQKFTLSREDGSFSITAAPGSTLMITAVSYETAEVALGSQSHYSVTLADKISHLSTVVVVGYGKQDRRNLTSSITSVKQEDINRGPISDPAQLLQGKVPGLNITRSGDPNASSSVILRGASTLRTGEAQQPFYVIDGVPGGDISLIAPDDITSIDILKDAAATSIYGTRAANGVIIVTTRRPMKGQLQLSYSGYAGVETVSSRIDMMDAPQLKNFLATNNLALDPADDQGANTDWQKEIQRTGVSHNHNIAFSGGSENTAYSASLNYFRQEGIMKQSNLDRFIGRITVEQKAFNDKLKLGFSLNNSVTNSDRIPNQQIPELTAPGSANNERGYLLANSARYLPTVAPRQVNGAYNENLNRNGYYNPVAMLDNAYNELQTKVMLANATAALQLPFGFTYHLSLAWQNTQYNEGTYFTKYYTDNYNQLLPTGATNGLAYRSSFQNTNKIAETYLTYDKQFGQHTITALVGYSWQQDNKGDGFQADNFQFASDALGYYGIGYGSASNYKVDWGNRVYTKLLLISDYGRLNYNYANKYFLQASIRRDGSSAFGPNNRWGYFPSVSGAWRISQESFMQSATFLDELKLRGGYGVTGNSLGFDPYIATLQYGVTGSFYYGGYVNALGPTQNANPNLKWEKTATANLGLDFSFLQGRISGSVDVYNKKTTDLIWNYSVSTSLYPVGTLTANAGAISNKGVELALHVDAVKNDRFSWTSSFNLAHNSNKVVSLSSGDFLADSIPLNQPDGGGQTSATLQIIKSGRPIGQFFTFQYAGKNANGVSQFYDRTGKVVSEVSQLTNLADYYYAGNPQPSLLLGWNNTFRYGHFDLNVFLRSVIGHKIFNATLADLNRPAQANQYNIPVFSASESAKDVNAYRYSTRFIESGTYVRLDNASLGYTFRNIASNFRSLRLYITGTNLLTITGYRGIDPEVNMGGLTPGVDANNFYPKTRTILFGVNATF
ncbi:TonB-dependent receptor [Chitinophaga japonensis]|uniref:Iron complex outermembrane receptor protein n=1 Tax=Chitinophaga japonensis TaxID=104662 RepID=A0A562TDK5_CHIJA|nr:TonB-dependent receptor [Chitinophaga japonensis]TWI91592.1 iron complex outermembrane receptor protein [Chitinophaga japonensis]